MEAKKDVDLLRLLRDGKRKPKEALALHIVTVKTAAPNPVTLTFEGTNNALDIDIFEVPSSFQPLPKGAKYFVLPLVGSSAMRWGLVARLDSPGATGSFTTNDSKTVNVEEGLIKSIT